MSSLEFDFIELWPWFLREFVGVLLRRAQPALVSDILGDELKEGTLAETLDPAATMDKMFTALANKDLFTVGMLQHEDVVEDFVVLGPIRGKQRVLAFFAELFAAVPDIEFVTERIMAVDADTAVGQWTIKGTFTGGPFQGIEPTGRSVVIRGIDVMEFEDGLLRHNTIYYDGLAFARQVGLLPKEGSRADRAMLSAFNASTKAKTRFRRGE